MTQDDDQLKDWLTHDEVVVKIMAEKNVSREEAERFLEEFDKAQPWAVDKKPSQ